MAVVLKNVAEEITNAVDNHLLSWKTVAKALMKYMSNDDLQTAAVLNGWDLEGMDLSVDYIESSPLFESREKFTNDAEIEEIINSYDTFSVPEIRKVYYMLHHADISTDAAVEILADRTSLSIQECEDLVIILSDDLYPDSYPYKDQLVEKIKNAGKKFRNRNRG